MWNSLRSTDRGSDAHQGKPARMPALGGTAAEPVRYLDFLIHAPVRSLLLHKAGIPVSVPAPERYAVHKLIVSTLRHTDANRVQKARKDLMQAGLLLHALNLSRRTLDIGLAWTEAWVRGPAWQTALKRGRRALGPEAATILQQSVLQVCEDERTDPAAFGFPAE